MTVTLPVHYEPVVASAMIGSFFSPCPPPRIAARRIRACAARARIVDRCFVTATRGLAIATVPVLRAIDGRSTRSGDKDRGAVRELSPTLKLHAAVADCCTGAPIDRPHFRWCP